MLGALADDMVGAQSRGRAPDRLCDRLTAGHVSLPKRAAPSFGESSPGRRPGLIILKRHRLKAAFRRCRHERARRPAQRPRLPLFPRPTVCSTSCLSRLALIFCAYTKTRRVVVCRVTQASDCGAYACQRLERFSFVSRYANTKLD